MRWHDIKEHIVDAAGFSREAIHIHVGMALFLTALAVFWKLRRRWLLAWPALVSVAVGNEALDAVDWVRWTGAINLEESVLDITHTILWPSIIAAAASFASRA